MSDLAERFNVSASTIKRRLAKMGKGDIPLTAHDVVVLMDTTYWGRNFGVVILMDASDSHVLWFKFIDRKERLEDYREGLEHLRESGLEVKAVVSDGFTGLKEMLSGIPYQLCQFHQLQRIRQLLTNNPKLPASIERVNADHVRQTAVPGLTGRLAWPLERFSARKDHRRKRQDFLHAQENQERIL